MALANLLLFYSSCVCIEGELEGHDAYAMSIPGRIHTVCFQLGLTRMDGLFITMN